MSWTAALEEPGAPSEWALDWRSALGTSAGSALVAAPLLQLFQRATAGASGRQYSLLDDGDEATGRTPARAPAAAGSRLETVAEEAEDEAPSTQQRLVEWAAEAPDDGYEADPWAAGLTPGTGPAFTGQDDGAAEDQQGTINRRSWSGGVLLVSEPGERVCLYRSCVLKTEWIRVGIMRLKKLV